MTKFITIRITIPAPGESTLDMYIWCSEAGVTGTFTVKAWYEGYAENAAVKTFKVHTKPTELVLYNVPDAATLYMNQGKGRLICSCKTKRQYADRKS